ncbi:unnamed protein product [Vicia faba]|uniref:Uncharacterized protein n=1 Tax=Vicia faba TaxID=3906 RepID=A0AAV1AXT7_VICFA|nr:unnamed protein product [Vicia faba]
MDSELPNCVLSIIFSKLNLKDQFKTCTLSKHWRNQWMLSSTNHNFDLYNTFRCNTLPNDIPLFQILRSQFTARLDQFVLNYQHATVTSIRVKFPLGDEHTDVIGRLISHAIAKGVKHIELLFSHESSDTDFIVRIIPYRFSFSLLFNSDSLTYLHLENCILETPMEFYGLKNLTTLVLQLVIVKQNLLEDLFSNCMHLVDLTLDKCDLLFVDTIISQILSHLKIVCRTKYMKVISIITPNLSSLEYFCHHSHSINLKAHMLSHFIYSSSMMGFVDMSSLKNVTTVVLDGIRFLQIWFLPYLFQHCLQLESVTLKNCPMVDEMEINSTTLRHLKIFDCCSGRSALYKISVDSKNLSSFEYCGHTPRKFSVIAPKLSKVFWNAAVREKNRNSFSIPKLKEKNLNSLGPIPKLSQIENLAIIMGHSQISRLKVLGRFQNLRELELFIEEAYYPFKENFSILDVLTASQHLQKFSLTVRVSSWVGFQIQRKNAEFFHNELEYVELHGGVCTTNAIELARNLMKNVNSLRKITFSPLDKFYIGAGRWTKGSDSYWFDRNFIYESLRKEVKEQCELIIL